MPLPVLTIGNRNYSSWSLRPWLVLRWGRISFETRLVRLGGEGYGEGRIAAIRAVSPSGKVPALDLGGEVIWDSLAISEWAAEQAPGLWPADPTIRALARAAVAEMHSGFPAVRRDLGMNLRRRTSGLDLPADTRADLERLDALLGGLSTRFGGPWLFGERSIADAFFLPIAARFRTYGVAPADSAAAWCATALADADFLEWESAAIAETWRIESTEALHRSPAK